MDRPQKHASQNMSSLAAESVSRVNKSALATKTARQVKQLERVRAEIERAPFTYAAQEESTVGDYFALLKPRVMSLVVFTGLTGIMLAPGSINPFIGFIALLCIAIGAGASGALNMWYDADIDAVMERTKERPIPLGRVAPAEALNLGITLSLGSILLMGIAVNAVSAALLALTIGFYLFIYTMWLKRRTPQNIVIGGAAGAFPPMIGWAAVTGSVSVESIVLFMIIFMWTPPHFWALALYRNSDYAAAGVPMLPVVAGRRETCNQILIYSLLMTPVALTPWLMGFASVLYGAGALVLSLIFIALALRVWQARDVGGEAADRSAKHLFAYSILYLTLIFAALLAEGVFDLQQGF
ncbi:MAG: heme o synthase [Pseudomonadota bacterium]